MQHIFYNSVLQREQGSKAIDLSVSFVTQFVFRHPPTPNQKLEAGVCSLMGHSCIHHTLQEISIGMTPMGIALPFMPEGPTCASACWKRQWPAPATIPRLSRLASTLGHSQHRKR
jgi:hypothetical protein